MDIDKIKTKSEEKIKESYAHTSTSIKLHLQITIHKIIQKKSFLLSLTSNYDTPNKRKQKLINPCDNKFKVNISKYVGLSTPKEGIFFSFFYFCIRFCCLQLLLYIRSRHRSYLVFVIIVSNPTQQPTGEIGMLFASLSLSSCLVLTVITKRDFTLSPTGSVQFSVPSLAFPLLTLVHDP